MFLSMHHVLGFLLHSQFSMCSSCTLGCYYLFMFSLRSCSKSPLGFIFLPDLPRRYPMMCAIVLPCCSAHPSPPTVKYDIGHQKPWLEPSQARAKLWVGALAQPRSHESQSWGCWAKLGWNITNFNGSTCPITQYMHFCVINSTQNKCLAHTLSSFVTLSRN